MRKRRYDWPVLGRKRGGVSWAVIGIGYGAGAAIALCLWAALHGGAAGDAAGQALPREDAIREKGASSTARPSISAGKSDPDETEITGGREGGKGRADEGNEPSAYEQPRISVYLSKTGKVETVPLETYVQGVVAAEMPLEFRPAALEAQAVAARTYAVRRLRLGERTGPEAQGADVTDTQEHQAYLSVAEMKRLKTDDRAGWEKVRDAAAATMGQILVYGDEPIEALFFSTSNGYTENSEEVFSVKRPYLRSVESPWDRAISDRAEETIEMELSEFYERLGIETVAAGGNAAAAERVRVLERTEGHRVKTMLAGDRRLDGTEVRRLLGLRSAAFDWKIAGGKAVLTVRGYGHGVGMSQWGAEGMAREGNNASRILAHYYKGARLEQVSKLANASENRL
ncbi:stage II sporulation protein D [Cohnella cellulosilytica]|uniref:Stage II sporulation protein D n=1 Tax=Cohnella cellulosilytica TaxID=986710 RepID=A0ABW2FE15_9BACL